MSRLDLRVGARFTGPPAQAVHAALQEAADTIAKMPATFLTYPCGGPVFPTIRRVVRPTAGDVVLDADFLARFGRLEVPRNLWRALGRFAVWVEPALIAEWLRLMRGYADRQGRKLDEGMLGTAMTWSEPTRETGVSRERAMAMMQAGATENCVWTGRRLEIATLDIDHCLPWTAWPCGDLWNLLPADRRVNQHKKRDLLPADELLKRAATAIQEWWQRAYLAADTPLLPQRFMAEARASLPGLDNPGAATSDEIFAALRVQRLRLRHDQQVPEWAVRTSASSNSPIRTPTFIFSYCGPEGPCRAEQRGTLPAILYLFQTNDYGQAFTIRPEDSFTDCGRIGIMDIHYGREFRLCRAPSPMSRFPPRDRPPRTKSRRSKPRDLPLPHAA
jgi:hypothetical protein